MLALYLDVPAGAQRDFVERAIAYICEKNPDAADRATILLGLVEKHRDRDQVRFQAAVLPLLGRLGTAAVYQKVQPLLNASQPELSAAAVRRALADRRTCRSLWELAEKSASRPIAPSFAGVYPRDHPPSDRPEAETLRMLKAAMNLADNHENKNLALRAPPPSERWRPSTGRPVISTSRAAQTACRVIVELGAPPLPATAQQGPFRADPEEGRSHCQGQIDRRTGRESPLGDVAGWLARTGALLPVITAGPNLPSCPPPPAARRRLARPRQPAEVKTHEAPHSSGDAVAAQPGDLRGPGGQPRSPGPGGGTAAKKLSGGSPWRPTPSANSRSSRPSIRSPNWESI